MNWNTLLQPTGSSTPNGNSSSATYDSFGRPASQTNGDGIAASITYLDDVNQTVATSPLGNVRTTLDGLGRPIKVETRDPNNNVKTIADTEYDSCTCSPAGKLKRQSLPYAPGGNARRLGCLRCGTQHFGRQVLGSHSYSGLASCAGRARAGRAARAELPARDPDSSCLGRPRQAVPHCFRGGARRARRRPV